MSDKLQGGVLAGSTSVSLDVVLANTSDNLGTTGVTSATTGLVVSYWRQGGSRTANTAPSDLAAVNSAYSAGGMKEVDATNMKGIYRMDWDNAAFASGADWVVLTVQVTGSYTWSERLALTTNVIQTGDSYARLGAPAGASIAADIAEVEVETDDIAAIKTQTDKLTFTVANQVDSNVLDWKSATAPAMTGDAFARLGAPVGASISVDVAGVQTDTTNIKTRIPAALTTGGNMKAGVQGFLDSVFTEGAAGRITAAVKQFFNIASPASTMDQIILVNTATTVTDLTAARAEPGQGTPAVNASLMAKIDYLYKSWRNKKDQTSSTWRLYNDDAATVDQKAAVADDGTTASKGEIATGP